MKIVFMGTPEAAVPTLRRCVDDSHQIVAVWTQPDRPSGRSNKLKMPPVKEFAVAHDIPVHQPAKIKTDEAREFFVSHHADACVVVAYGRILPAAFLCAPRHGCVNVHFSLLPKYRGAAPVNWAIVNGETETGVTTMQMDEGLDTGAILLQEKTRIGVRESAPELMSRLALLGAKTLSRTLHEIDDLKPRAQDETQASYAPILKREDGLIDWTSDALAIERRIRGFHPFPAAYTFLRDRRLIVREAVPMKVAALRGEAGIIVELNRDQITVACGAQTELRLQIVQPEGKPAMRAWDFANGAHLESGERLG